MPTVLICARCNQPFSVRPCEANRRRFCSKACQYPGRYITRACASCGKTYKALVTRAERSAACSRSCWHQLRVIEVLQRRLDKIDRSGGPDACWPYLGKSAHAGGYIQFSHKGKVTLLHRLIYEREVGPIPPGMLVCHSCDNPPRCNPSHYFLGTTQDNTADRDAKGRQMRGSRHPRAQMTESQVAWAKSRFGILSDNQIADQLGVSSASIGFMRRGKTWRHVIPSAA